MLRVVVVGARPVQGSEGSDGAEDPDGPDVTERLARGLRDGGHEVVLVGAATSQQVAAVALQEDADLVVLLGQGPEVDPEVEEVRDLLYRAGADDVDVRAVERREDAVRGLVAGLSYRLS